MRALRTLVPLLLAFGGAPPPIAAQMPSGDSPPATEVLECAFRKRFDRAMAQVIDVEAKRGAAVVRRFRIQMASLPLDGRFRSLVYFLRPPDHRGMRVLTIENEDRSDEHFVFLPFLDRVKRVHGGRRQESFLGTDFSYEDMERTRSEEFVATLVAEERLGEDAVYVVSAEPRYESAYLRSEYLVAKSDCNLLEVRHYKKGSDSPSKILSIPRDRMTAVNGELMPTWALARDLQSGGSTELHFSEIQLDPDLDERDFTLSALERMEGIRSLSSREGRRQADTPEPERDP